MKIVETKILSQSTINQLLKLWNREYPAKLNYDSPEAFEKYLQGLESQSHLLLLDQYEALKGWFFSFNRDEERWFGILIDQSAQGLGLGSKLLLEAQAREPELNGWVVDHNHANRNDGTSYRSPLDFYLKHAFEILPDCRLETDQLSAVKVRWRNIELI